MSDDADDRGGEEGHDRLKDRRPPFVAPTGREIGVSSILEIDDVLRETLDARIEVRGRQSRDLCDAPVVIEVTHPDDAASAYIGLGHVAAARGLARAIDDAADFAEKMTLEEDEDHDRGEE